MSRKVDLHIHSYASDGEWSPKQLLEHVDAKNIKIFAVCDHDETACIPYMQELTWHRDDLEYIKGVEITSTFKDREFHILTYYINEEDGKLQNLLEYNRKQRIDYNTKLIEFLNKRYKEISLEDFEAYDYNPYRGGWEMYHYLMDKGMIFNLSDYFVFVKDFQGKMVFHDPTDLIPKLNALGYTTILAHPSGYTKGDLLEESTLEYFRNIGIQGIECYTNYLSDPNNSQYYLDYCKKNGLIITGGSDCHGSFVERKLGQPHITENMISLLDRKDK